MPCSVFGRAGQQIVRVFDPHAAAMSIETPVGWCPMTPTGIGGLFEWRGAGLPARYRLRAERAGDARIAHDPYAFAPTLTAHDLYLFNEGRFHQAYRALGAQPMELDGMTGFRFAVWAPTPSGSRSWANSTAGMVDASHGRPRIERGLGVIHSRNSAGQPV